MRIAIVSELFLPKVDGIVNTLCYLLEHLARTGHQSLLLAPQGAPDQYARTPIIGLPASPLFFYPEIQLIPPWTAVDSYLNEFRPDVIHVVNPVSIGLRGLEYARRRCIPVVASYHTDIPGFARRWGFDFLQGAFWSFTRWVHNQADLNLCPSRATLDELRQQGFQRLKLWTRGVDLRKYSPNRRSMVWRNRLTDGHPDAPLLLFVGRLSPEKRVDWLLATLQAIPGARLAVVGDGPQRGSLQSTFAGTPTVFTGYLRGEELAAAYAAADLFVFPAANETFGNVVLEAMASGLPVIAPRSGGVLDTIRDGYNGYLFAPEDCQEMTSLVERLLKNPNEISALRQNALQTAQARDWGNVIEGLIDDYASLIGRSDGCRPAPATRRGRILTGAPSSLR